MNKLFPVFLKLENLHTLIVGGGYVGLEKITAVLENSPEAKLTLIAPEIRQEIQDFAKEHTHIELIFRKFEANDLNEKDLVLVATNDKQENASIKSLAAQRHLLCNVADTPHLCDFYLSSVVRKGELKFAISTNGKSPTIAKRIKQVLDENFPIEINESLENLTKIRETLRGDFSEKVQKLNQITQTLVEAPKPPPGPPKEGSLA
ncbi:MAG: bifunctional precorrin-2 dehydrogenase/sirohydrochlorin ferrochelatase [Verrucomicrobia bacterium]|nr:bifunctional precorrin-2 dehydrogenase/sirohydrochlorin ferrochelatase [Cytophagales bacterium]